MNLKTGSSVVSCEKRYYQSTFCVVCTITYFHFIAMKNFLEKIKIYDSSKIV